VSDLQAISDVLVEDEERAATYNIVMPRDAISRASCKGSFPVQNGISFSLVTWNDDRGDVRIGLTLREIRGKRTRKSSLRSEDLKEGREIGGHVHQESRWGNRRRTRPKRE
jgi:hypothetical protein